MCRWAAARPRAVRAASFARRVVSKPGQAPPPPTGTAAAPSGALHASGAWCADRCGASTRSPARPRASKHALSSVSHAIPSCPQSAALRKARNFNDYNSKHEVCAGELHANVCRLGPAVSRGCCCWALQGQAARLSETPVAFACWYLCGSETGIAFVCAKWAFLVQFSGAEVMSVSTVAVQGRAVVMVVSCWPASVAAEASLVSTSPCRSILCAKKFALFGPGRLRPQGPNEAPAHASCAGGRQGKDCLELKRCTQRVEGT